MKEPIKRWSIPIPGSDFFVAVYSDGIVFGDDGAYAYNLTPHEVEVLVRYLRKALTFAKALEEVNTE